MAVFVCQYPFSGQSDYRNDLGNLRKTVKVIDANSCALISSYLQADPANDDVMDAINDLETNAVASSQGVHLYTGGTAQTTPSRPFKISRGD